MILCSLCKEPSSFAFNARHVKVHRCHNEDCLHLFAIDMGPFAGVHDYEEEMKVDFSQYSHRNNRLIRYWKSVGFLRPHYRVLDFGSGTGHILASLKEQMPELDITAIEMNESYHANLKSMGVRVIKDLRAIPAGETFDAILMIEVLEHLDNPL